MDRRGTVRALCNPAFDGLPASNEKRLARRCDLGCGLGHGADAGGQNPLRGIRSNTGQQTATIGIAFPIQVDVLETALR
jgi:hypothetical protein